ncbi:MAG: cyclase family protein [Planctomycetota bacterium]
MRYYDISVPVFDGMVAWPSDPPVRVRTHKSVKRGDRSNVEKLEFSSHTGTHLDAPNHIGLDRTVDEIPIGTLVGPAVVVTSRAKREVSADDIDGLDLKTVERILFKTRNSSRPDDGRFHDDFVALSPELAERLANARVKLVGIDAMSVDAKGGKGEVHRTLLEAGVVLLENINLSNVSAGEYELLCLPLRIAGGDGAPARAVLRSLPPLGA